MEKIPGMLWYVGGGIGDQVCAEPALRYALSQFGEFFEVSILSHFPWLFSHLKFKEIFSTNGPADYDTSKYIFRSTYPRLLTEEQRAEAAKKEAICSFHANAVDYCAIQLLKWQLPFNSREIQLTGELPREEKHAGGPDPMMALKDNAVVLHPGVTWPSRTFPIQWWNEVIDGICRLGGLPVIIGQQTENNGVHLIKNTNVVNLTDRLNVKELIFILQRCKVLITNDSLPLHVAASSEPNGLGGSAWIGFLATAKHPDFLMHYRKGVLGWRMENLSKGGVWAGKEMIKDEKGIRGGDGTLATPEQMKQWLPLPSIVSRWAILAGRGELGAE